LKHPAVEGFLTHLLEFGCGGGYVLECPLECIKIRGLRMYLSFVNKKKSVFKLFFLSSTVV
jgi:hypothetical protein